MTVVGEWSTNKEILLTLSRLVNANVLAAETKKPEALGQVLNEIADYIRHCKTIGVHIHKALKRKTITADNFVI